MTQRQIARLACKLLAVYFTLDALKYVYTAAYLATSVFGMTGYYGPSGSALFISLGLAILMPIVQIAIGVWLWKRAGVVAAWITGHNLQDQENEPDAAPVPANLEAVHAVALSVMGVWVLVEAIPETLNFIIGHFLIEGIGGGFNEYGSAIQAATSLTTIVVKLAIGFWLIFGSPGIVRMLRGFVYVGLDPSERPGGGAPPPAPGAGA